MMTFHESYGDLPTKTLRLIRKHNVSPADFDLILGTLMSEGYDMEGPAVASTWAAVDSHIVSNSETGMYRPQFF